MVCERYRGFIVEIGFFIKVWYNNQKGYFLINYNEAEKNITNRRAFKQYIFPRFKTDGRYTAGI